MLWSDAPATLPTPDSPDPVATAGPDPVATAGPDPVATAGPAAPPGPYVAGLAGPASRDVAADEAFLAEIAAELDSVEAALVRLDDGTFDRCQVCGDRIAEERLMADPLATRCSVHA